jgi:hypothetical protein
MISHDRSQDPSHSLRIVLGEKMMHGIIEVTSSRFGRKLREDEKASLDLSIKKPSTHEPQETYSVNLFNGSQLRIVNDFMLSLILSVTIYPHLRYLSKGHCRRSRPFILPLPLIYDHIH